MFNSQKFSALSAVMYMLLYLLYKVVYLIVNFLIIADILLYEIYTNYQVVGKLLLQLIQRYSIFN